LTIIIKVMKKQVHIFYTGRVQGVGFRFTTEDIANALGVCGWVRNLCDGRVEVLAEAQEEVLKEFLCRISNYFGGYIQKVDTTWQEVTQGFRDFRIRF
jgi:acylphosphatase